MARPVRSFAKAISWRFIASFITIICVWAATGSLELGGLVGGADFLIKLVVYYIHERIWAKIEWGRSFSRIAKGPHEPEVTSNNR